LNSKFGLRSLILVKRNGIMYIKIKKKSCNTVFILTLLVAKLKGIQFRWGVMKRMCSLFECYEGHQNPRIIEMQIVWPKKFKDLNIN